MAFGVCTGQHADSSFLEGEAGVRCGEGGDIVQELKDLSLYDCPGSVFGSEASLGTASTILSGAVPWLAGRARVRAWQTFSPAGAPPWPRRGRALAGVLQAGGAEGP